MTQQILEFPLSRNTDKQTSRDAAHAAATRGRLEQLIVDTHRQHPEGLTDMELGTILSADWYYPTIVSARSRLTRGATPLLVDSGKQRSSRRPGAARSTRKTVWTLKGGTNDAR